MFWMYMYVCTHTCRDSDNDLLLNSKGNIV